MKRNTNPTKDEILPITTSDDKINNSGQSKSLQQTSNQSRRRSTSKTSALLRIIGGLLTFFVVSLYVLGTRYVLLISPSIPSTSQRGSVNDVVFNRWNHLPVKYQPIIVNKPRVLGHYYARTDSKSFVGTERLDPNLERLYDNDKFRIHREEFMSKDEIHRQKHLLKSNDYADGMADTMKDQGEDCVAQYDWQETTIPTCNLMMEVDMTNLNRLPMFHENHYNNKHDLPVASSALHSYSQLISNGHWRDVWKIENLLRHNGNEEETFILKTMRYEHDYVERNYDRHRRDAVAMEQLSGSQFIMDIYAACGNSGLFQYADGGSLSDAIYYNYHLKDGDIENPWTPQEKLVIAYQVVSGLTDLHNFAQEGVPAISHTDIDADQFVYVDEAGLYKLNDFNRARFLGKHEKTNEVCSYFVGSNPGSFRSPEEYRYDAQTAKVDVFQVGNTLYNVLTGKYPFYDEKDSHEVRHKVKNGERPHISSTLRNSTDPFNQAFIKAIEMSWIHEPEKRATAREMQTFIVSELERLQVKKDN